MLILIFVCCIMIDGDISLKMKGVTYMKKLICVLLVFILCFALFSCTEPDSQGDSNNTDIGSDIPDSPDEPDLPADPDLPDEPDDSDNTDKAPDALVPDEPDGYAKPSNFAKAYKAVSDIRYDFYESLASSVSASGDNSNMYVDVYYAMAGESTFVYVSVCGSTGYKEAVKTALAMGGYHNAVIEEREDGSYRITADVPVATSVELEESYVKGCFDVSYDKEADVVSLSYSAEDGHAESFTAKRIKGGYIANYESSDGVYLRYELYDDKTGKMAICNSAFEGALPDGAEGFIPEDGFKAVYELSESKFHSIYDGIEYTYPRIDSDNSEG